MDKNRKQSNPAKWIALAAVIMIGNPALIPLGIVAGISWLVIHTLKKQAATGSGHQPRSTVKASSTRYTTRQASFDECPQSIFCRHKDKSEHHVRRGKEIDPWDRPDIDISKYQRNRK